MTEPIATDDIALTEDKIVLNFPVQSDRKHYRKDIKNIWPIYAFGHAWQWFIIALVIVQACLVGGTAVVGLSFCAVERSVAALDAEESLGLGSICILSFFVLEWTVEAFVHGVREYGSSALHIFDILLVCTSLLLEAAHIMLDENRASVGGMVILLRLWRFVRVIEPRGDVQHGMQADQIEALKMENIRLQQVERAHHTLIRSLHHEFICRLHGKKNLGDSDEMASCIAVGPHSLPNFLASISMLGQHAQQAVQLHMDSAHICGAST